MIKAYNICLMKKYFFLRIFILLILIQNISYVYAQLNISNNQLLLLCKIEVTADVGNRGQITEELYNFNISPPSVNLSSMNITYPVIYSESEIQIIGGNYAIINRYTGTYRAIGMQGNCQKAPGKKLF